MVFPTNEKKNTKRKKIWYKMKWNEKTQNGNWTRKKTKTDDIQIVNKYTINHTQKTEKRFELMIHKLN